MKFIDVHCHIAGEEFPDEDELFGKIRAAGVEKVIVAGFDLESSKRAADLAARRGEAYFTAGIHPTEVYKARAGDFEKIAALAQEKKCVAIGETGLDYHYPDTDAGLQKEYFARHIALAEKLCLPVQIHSRDCAADTLEIVRGNAERLKRGFLLHCFSYSPEVAAEFSKLGGYFSFGGVCTYGGSKKAARTISFLPASRITTETDSPYLAPLSRKGQFPNTPESIPEIAEKIASIRGESLETAVKNAWETAHNLFKKLGPAQ